MPSENEQKTLKGIELPGAPAFSRYLNEKFGERVTLGDVVENMEWFRVPILIDCVDVGNYHWQNIKWLRDHNDRSYLPNRWWYAGVIPGYKNESNSERIQLLYVHPYREDFNKIPFP